MKHEKNHGGGGGGGLAYEQALVSCNLELSTELITKTGHR